MRNIFAFYQSSKSANNKALSERFKQLQDSPKITAIKNIIDRINEGDVRLSQWYLERKMRNEYNMHVISHSRVEEPKPKIDFAAEAMKRVKSFKERAKKINLS